MASTPSLFLRGTVWSWRRRVPEFSTQNRHWQLSLRSVDLDILFACRARDCVRSIGLCLTPGRPHSMCRTKIVRTDGKTGDLRALHLLLRRIEADSPLRPPGGEIEDALAISQSDEI